MDGPHTKSTGLPHSYYAEVSTMCYDFETIIHCSTRHMRVRIDARYGRGVRQEAGQKQGKPSNGGQKFATRLSETCQASIQLKDQRKAV